MPMNFSPKRIEVFLRFERDADDKPILTSKGEFEEVVAYCAEGVFAVHPCVGLDVGKGWTVTHMPTGWYICKGLRSRAEAEMVCATLEPYIDLFRAGDWNTIPKACPMWVGPWLHCCARERGHLDTRKFKEMYGDEPKGEGPLHRLQEAVLSGGNTQEGGVHEVLPG